jgi:hypothetical protein
VHGSDLFVIWGRIAADLESKIKKAKASGDLNPGDRYSARIWPRSTEMIAGKAFSQCSGATKMITS